MPYLPVEVLQLYVLCCRLRGCGWPSIGLENAFRVCMFGLGALMFNY